MISTLYHYLADIISPLLRPEILPQPAPVAPIPGGTPPVSIPLVHPSQLSYKKHLGLGGASVVSAATFDGMEVAVKKFKKLFVYKRELEIHQNLNHPNIILLLATLNDTKNSTYLLIIELAIHGTLTNYLENHYKKNRKEEIVAQYGNQLAEGIYYLHSKKIIHCDIKPNNALIASDGTLKICDFSLAFQLNEQEDFRDLNGRRGSTAYMAPEIGGYNPFNFWSIYRYSPKVDVYGLGLMLSLLVTSQESEYFDNHYHISWEVERTASPELSRLIRFCLKDDPSQRPDALTVLQSLRQPEIKFRSK